MSLSIDDDDIDALLASSGIETVMSEEYDMFTSLDSTVVTWPGQSAINACNAAKVRPEWFYDVHAVNYMGHTQRYIEMLAQMAGLGDWMAHIWLSVYMRDDANNAMSELPIFQLYECTASASPFELYAFGSFMHSFGSVASSLHFWKNERCSPRCVVPLAKIEGHLDLTAAFTALCPDIPGVEPTRSYLLRDKATLCRLARTDPLATIMYARITDDRAEARKMLTEMALRGHECCAEQMFGMRLPPTISDATRMSKAGIQCVHRYVPLPRDVPPPDLMSGDTLHRETFLAGVCAQVYS